MGTLDFGDCLDFGDFHFLCFEGCYEIRGNHGTLASCWGLVDLVYLSTGLSWPFPFLGSPPFPRGSCPFPECSRNVPPRYIGVRDPVYRCLGPGLSFDADPLRGVPGVFPECSPPLINGVPVKRCLGLESSGVPSDLSWVGREVFGALQVMRCLGPNPLFSWFQRCSLPGRCPPVVGLRPSLVGRR